MDYLLQSPTQLSSHLRALRKARGLSQAQLGALLGVGQARMARIEQAPEAVSVEQIFKVLSVLGVQLVLRPKPAPAVSAPARTQASANKKAVAKVRKADEPW
jgi:HTH-type transcriptional regulator / antitoxin HipB